MTHSGHDCGAFGYGEQRNSPSKNVIFLLIPDVALGGGSSHEAAGNCWTCWGDRRCVAARRARAI